ncbi:excinuclease ABC subunit UvrA [Haloferax namakaokahaiae]|uniref:Excinuclease ABC subunit UvrA n=1 Tax=Haloferax namakaokahaiae TaxID=1748331 RepID=A0ABD5ZHH5_9EURY
MSKDYIEVRGAEEHNLKDLDVRIPRETFTVVTGLSGSGKSSLAFDTVYAEGQRRYIESLSAYARNFLGQMDKPKVEAVEGLSPAISIDQKNGANNPRSTVGTVTELHDYLRLLYARVGTQYDPITGEEVGEQSAQDMVEQILEFPAGTRAMIAAPVVRDQKGEFKDLFSDLVSEGYARVEVDGDSYDLSFETPELDKNYDHTIDVIVDRIKVSPESRSRIADSVETALEEANGVLKLIVPDPPENPPFASNTRSTGALAGEGDDRLVVEFSEELGNPNSSFRFSEIETRSFSFNSPHGACPECEGLGKAKEVDPDLVVTDPSKKLKHVFEPWSYNRTYYRRQIDCVADHFGVSVNTPFEDLDEDVQEAFLFGTYEDVVFEWTTKNGTRHKEHPFEGVVTNLERRHVETDSDRTRDHIEDFMAVTTCPACNGSRLKEQSRHVRVGGTALPEANRMTIAGALEHFEGLETDLSEREKTIAQEILKEIRARLGFMMEVGLDYLTLDREAATLSGGESQRIRLATQVGSGLVGVLYVLDEPSIGLHQRDNDKLLNTLEGLRDLGNTLIVVEHDEETMRRADEIIDMGPGPGKRGGEIVAQGDFDDIVAADNSLTADYLSGRKDIDVPETRREGDGELTVVGARQHNLKDLDVPIPLGTFTAITGVSGSGKSTLMHEILYKGLARTMNDNTSVDPGEHDEIAGYDQIETVRLIDQSPIGRTPRSNPATYTGVFDYVRELFASTKLSKQRGYEKGRFSFNVKGGRCEECKGQGTVKIEMNFLSDVYVPCEECHGARYNTETLDVTYKDKTIAEVLDMEVDEALEFFESNSQIRRRLQLLHDVGLGYMQLGQPSTTLSGGEAQRVKLAEELGKRQKGDTLYLLDEPTTGLHKEDERKLIDVLQRLVDNGNTVVVVEHELDLVKNADHVLDLGPEGGAGGGTIVASGTPEEVAQHADSHTGRYLRDYLPEVDKEGPRADRRKPAKVPNDD